jgi:aspartyl-tRNA synthetase
MYRTSLINVLSLENTDKIVTLSGWVDTIRDHGGIIFIDLRDVSGTIQLVIHPEISNYNIISNIKSEYVIQVIGKVIKRSEENINKNISTGYIELEVNKLDILNSSMPLPFEINEDRVEENLKYKYRYLNMRGKKTLNILKKRSQFMHILRNFMYDNGFMEVDTPILGRATPEGARDFLVPSRINKNKYYALPQSPQIYKQTLMVAGIDRYFQISKCFRDEDLRSDRQPEFLQLDCEASFVNESDVMNFSESLVKEILKDLMNISIDSIPVMSYDEAINSYGSDKPDISFDMKIKDLTNIAKEFDFKVFRDTAQKGAVKAINFKGGADKLSRKDIDVLTDYAKISGAKGLAWLKFIDGNYSSVISKFFNNNELDSITNIMEVENNDILFFVADSKEIVQETLGRVRLKLADNYSLRRDGFHFLWVVDFPMFEWSESDKKYKSVHHPFTQAKDNDPKISKAYDLVLNGNEIAGGSIRIHNYEKQIEAFKFLGIDKDEAEDKFGNLLSALKYGAPPHGGIAFGIDRFLTILLGLDSIREVIPFPKTQSGLCLFTGAPAAVNEEDLNILNIVNKKDKKD